MKPAGPRRRPHDSRTGKDRGADGGGADTLETSVHGARFAWPNSLTLSWKVALIPALTLVLMGLMLTVAVRMGEQNTAALRTLDRDVFEPLNRAQTLKDRVTLLHTRLFALLSAGNNERNPIAQKASAAGLEQLLDAEVANFGRFMDGNSAVPPPAAGRLRATFDDYIARAKETIGFAAYDASYGALLAGVTNDRFDRLHAELESLVAALSRRRGDLAGMAVDRSLDARRLLIGLGAGAVVLSMLGTLAVGRGIARPILRLTALMNELARGETGLTVPGTARKDEVGAMARAVEVFRANAIARRLVEVELRRTNTLFDAALNSMLQGMVVWGPDRRVRLVNERFLAMCDLPTGEVGPGMTVSEMIHFSVRHGLHPGVDSEELCSVLAARLIQRRSIQVEQAMRPGLTVRIAYEPMADGGTVVTFEDVTEKRQYEERIAFMARHDALTGLPNRTLLREHMAEAAARPGDGTRYAVLCLDLDRFKEVNDTLGHAAGDELLRLVAGRLRGCAREQDLIARLGGDEFAIVLTAEDDAHAPAASLAARIVEAIGEPFDVQGQSLLIGTSIGIALPDRGEPACAAPDARRRTAELLLKRADIALYRAKEERGTYVFFEPGMDEVLNMRRGLEADLRLALEYDEFELNFMPLYNLAEDRVTGFEALVRWNSPARGRVAPADFIAVAEQTGLIVPLGEWVLRTACFEAAAWPDDVLVAVNLSPVQFKSKQLVAMVCEALRESGLPATRLELEITETVLLRDTEAVMTVLRSLHELGVRVSMDDFGTGYSSLSYLRRFPFDKIKIDRSFVNDLRASPAGGAESGDPRSAAAKSAATIVRAIACLGENLGIATTAEGVETAEQLAEIRSAGCTEVQGYYIGPPRPASEVPAMLRRREAAAPPAKSELYLSARQVA